MLVSVDVVIKITLVAAVLLMGYNLSQTVAAYQSVCRKADEFKKLAAENESDEDDLRRSNFLLSFVLSLIFVGLTYFSGLSIFVVAVVAVKLMFTLYCSDTFLVQILRNESVPKKFYLLSKCDSLLNTLFGFGVALFLVL